MPDPIPLRPLAAPLEQVGQKPPPANIQAEQALLGALLANAGRAFEYVAGFLKPEHFADALHSQLYGEIARRILEGRNCDAVTLMTDLAGAPMWADHPDGVKYLPQLLTAMIGISYCAEYGRAIYDCWLRRRLIDIGEEVVERAYGADPALDGEAQVQAAEERLMALADGRTLEAPAIVMRAGLAQVMAEVQAAYEGRTPLGMSTGLIDVDRVLGELWPGELVILGGRPGMGKTSLAVQIAVAVARDSDADADGVVKPGAGVLFMSLEMPTAGILRIMLAQRTGITARDLKRGAIGGSRASALYKARSWLDELPVWIDDKPAQGLAPLIIRARMEARRMARSKVPLRLLVVDHIQKLATDQAASGRSNKADDVGRITSGLKNLAKSLNCCVLALSQLNREVERREDPRPKMSDLMYAGEADADAIAFMHRPEVYLAKKPPSRGPKQSDDEWAMALDRHEALLREIAGVAELIGAKARDGEVVEAKLHYDGPSQRFRAW